MKYVLLILSFFFIFSCKTDLSKDEENLAYSTSVDALKSYRQGWVQIMDEGSYGKAETSYRKALGFDPNFLVGKSVLARLTLNLDERLLLYKELQEGKDKIAGDERLILDVYTALVNYTNLRDQASPETKNALEQALRLGEDNLKKVVHKYPEEVYLKAEYIEILNSNYGPRQALDSLHSLTTDAQKENPFLLGIEASMHAELEEYDIAMQKANLLFEVVNDSTLPKTYAVLADIYFKIGNLKIAKSNADRATQLDTRNLDASRLKKKIDDALAEQEAAISTDTK